MGPSGNQLKGWRARATRGRRSTRVKPQEQGLGNKLTKLRHLLWGVTTRAGVRTCKRHLVGNDGGVRPVRDGTRTALRNLVTCKVWKVCPDCGYRELTAMRRMIETALAANHRKKGSAALVTLTLQFERGTGLARRWDHLAGCIAKLARPVAVVRARKEAGWLGALKLVHPVYTSGGGWHIHVHFLYFFNRKITMAELETLRRVEVASWREAARSRRLRPPSNGRQDYQMVENSEKSFRRVAKYLTKGIEEIQFDDRRETAVDGESVNGRSPWSILNDIATEDDGEPSDLLFWREWEAASVRRHMVDWSDAVLEVLDLTARSTEQREQRIDSSSPTCDPASFVIVGLHGHRAEHEHGRRITSLMSLGFSWSAVVAYCLTNRLQVVYDHGGVEHIEARAEQRRDVPRTVD